MIPNAKGKTILPIVDQTVERDSTVYADELPTCNRLTSMGYNQSRILQSSKVYVMGNVHTNTMEGPWSLVNPFISGVCHSVSAKYLQHYVNEYAFRYNYRHDEIPMFVSFLCRARDAVAD